MRWPKFLPAYSSTEWAVRVGLAVAVASAGYCSVTRTMAYSLRSSATETAYDLAPDDGRIGGLLAEKYSRPEASGAERGKADSIARKALSQDATAVQAVATLGIDAATRNQSDMVRRTFDYSQKLSRRELRTRLWAIESAVSRGDLDGALQNYDIALRTSRAAPEVLFPVLSAAISDGEVRVALVKTMSHGAPWNDDFISFLDGKAPDVQVKANLFIALRHARVEVPPAAQSHAVDGLIAADKVQEAWQYYSVIRPGAGTRSSRDPRFAANIETPSSFDWNPQNASGVSSSIQRFGDAGAFDFSISPGASGPLLRQLQLLNPGEYVLEGDILDLDAPTASRPYWLIACPDGRQLLHAVLPNAPTVGGHLRVRFAVPTGCPRQTLSLYAPSAETSSGLSGRITTVMLKPANSL